MEIGLVFLAILIIFHVVKFIFTSVEKTKNFFREIEREQQKHYRTVKKNEVKAMIRKQTQNDKEKAIDSNVISSESSIQSKSFIQESVGEGQQLSTSINTTSPMVYPRNNLKTQEVGCFSFLARLLFITITISASFFIGLRVSSTLGMFAGIISFLFLISYFFSNYTAKNAAGKSIVEASSEIFK